MTIDLDIDDTVLIHVESIVRDHGTVVEFQGVTADGRIVKFAADHRSAQDLVDALASGEDPVAAVEPWAILSYV